jgi:hypothetical protein
MEKRKTIIELAKLSVSKSKYYAIDSRMTDEKKDLILEGVLYNKEKEKVNQTIFYDGNEKTEMHAPYLYIIDQKSSNTKNRRLLDKICMDDIVVSPKIQNLFSELKIPNFKFYDLVIKGIELEISDYKILKILGNKIDCVDLEKSDLKLSSSGNINPFFVNKLVVDETKIPEGTKLFVLGRTSEIVVVHEDVKNAIESKNLTGFLFFALEHFYTPKLIEAE